MKMMVRRPCFILFSVFVTLTEAFPSVLNNQVYRFPRRRLEYTRRVVKPKTCTSVTEYATCNMVPAPNSTFTVTGTVNMKQTLKCRRYGPLEFHVNLSGFPTSPSPTLHGLHIHTYGDLRHGCASMGPHFNPFNKQHGAPSSTNRHVGDLGNLQVKPNGTTEGKFRDSLPTLFGKNSIIGRSLIVKAMEDDLGKGGNPDSLITGNAGADVACCVIGRYLPGTVA